MNRRHRTVRQAITAALTTPKALAYRTLSGVVATWVDQGRLIRTGDLLDRLGADLPDGQISWYGRHVAKAYRAAHDGAAAIKVWAQHRTTGRWIHVHVYAPTEPALYEALQSYKATRSLTRAALVEAAQTELAAWELTPAEEARLDRTYWNRDYDDDPPDPDD